MSDPPPERPCDCTHTGNTQHIGPGCQRAIDEVWGEAIRRSREIATSLQYAPTTNEENVP